MFYMVIMKAGRRRLFEFNIYYTVASSHYDIFQFYNEAIRYQGVQNSKLPLILSKSSQHTLLAILTLAHTSSFGLEYHQHTGVYWFDLSFKCNFLQFNKLRSSLSCHARYSSDLGKSHSVFDLISLLGMRFDLSGFGFWLECDSILSNCISIFLSPPNKSFFNSDISQKTFLMSLSYYISSAFPHSPVFVSSSTFSLLAEILSIVRQCNGLVFEFGIMNRDSLAHHYKLLVSPKSSSLGPSIHKDLSFVFSLINLLVSQFPFACFHPCLDSFSSIINLLKPSSLMSSLSIYHDKIFVDIEIYPPEDSVHIDKFSGLSAGYTHFWDSVSQLFGFFTCDTGVYSRYTILPVASSIEDRLHHIKIKHSFSMDRHDLKYYRKLRVFAR